MKCVSRSPAAKAGCDSTSDQERPVGGHAGDAQALERVAQPDDRLVARRSVRDHLGEQRIVVHAHLVPRRHARVPSHVR